MNHNFRLDSPENAVSNEIWAVGPNFMSNSYSHLIVDMINELIFGYHHTIRIGILRTYGPRDRRIKYCILVIVISNTNKLVVL